MPETGPPDFLVWLHRSLPATDSAISWVFGAAAVAACALLKLLLDHAVGSPVPPYITFYPAMVIASLFGGLIVGLACAVVTLLLVWYFWLPEFASFAIPDTLTGATVVIYAFTAPAIAVIVGGARLSLDKFAASELERAAAARESVHRIKNLIAVVQALVAKIRREADTLPEFNDILIKRLHALSLAQDLLVRSEWQDADLDELLQTALAPFIPNPGLTVQKGEHVLVPARHVRGLCMALYELCTNSMKYGALAYGRGPARLSWHVAGPDCVLEWREEVSEEETHRAKQTGFGTILIRMALSNETGTAVNHAVNATQVLATFHWPANLRSESVRSENLLRARALSQSGSGANSASA